MSAINRAGMDQELASAVIEAEVHGEPMPAEAWTEDEDRVLLGGDQREIESVVEARTSMGGGGVPRTRRVEFLNAWHKDCDHLNQIAHISHLSFPMVVSQVVDRNSAFSDSFLFSSICSSTAVPSKRFVPENFDPAYANATEVSGWDGGRIQ